MNDVVSPYRHLPAQIPNDKILRLLGQQDWRAVQEQIERIVLKQVEIESNCARARSDKYKVQIRFRSDHLEGECDCPESDGFEFCIHCAALCVQ
ncbi:MAG: hypothetical protein CUN55_18565, partial [Phototrophicales bacterium]